MKEIEFRIIEIIEELSVVPVTDVSVLLIDDLALDSFKMIMLLIMLEEEFEIQFDETDLDPKKIVRVQDVISLVYKYWQ